MNDQLDSSLETGLIATVQRRLRELRERRTIEPLKELFWTDLNYTRVNRPLPYHRDWQESVRKSLHLADAHPLLLFASGGKDNDFAVISVHLESDRLLSSEERPIVMKL